MFSKPQGIKELPLMSVEGSVCYPQTPEFSPEMLCRIVIDGVPELIRFFNEHAAAHPDKIKRDYIFHVLAFKCPGLLTFLLQRVTNLNLIKKNFPDADAQFQVSPEIVGFLQGAGRALHKKSKKALSGVRGPQENNEQYIGTAI